jgi:hypothetical protein
MRFRLSYTGGGVLLSSKDLTLIAGKVVFWLVEAPRTIGRVWVRVNKEYMTTVEIVYDGDQFRIDVHHVNPETPDPEWVGELRTILNRML